MQHTHIFFNSKQACEYLGISRRSLSRVIVDQKIRYSKPGGTYRFHRSWLDAYLLGFHHASLTPKQQEQLRELDH
jgi:excisionase family DNA binding protein